MLIGYPGLSSGIWLALALLLVLLLAVLIGSFLRACWSSLDAPFAVMPDPPPSENDAPATLPPFDDQAAQR